MQVILFFLSIIIAWYLGRRSEDRIINTILRLYNNSDQLTEAIQSGKKTNYVEKNYPDIMGVKQNKSIILTAHVANKLKSIRGEAQKEIEGALKRLAEGIFSPACTKRLVKSKFLMYRVGKHRLIFEEKEDKFLIVDFW